MTSTFPLFATAPKGVASLLFDELKTLGATNLKEQPAGVLFEGTLETAYRACLWSRTANRILLPLSNFHAPTPEALYENIQEIDWSEHMSAYDTLAIDFNLSSSRITHTHFAALKVKDAIVDQFRDRCDERPSIDTNRPDLRINVHLHRDQASVSIDLSGDSLHKRGYRVESVKAPLKENLAAALLLRAGWPEIAQKGGSLVDPMCGSGTFLIEAALIAMDIAPGLDRDFFGFLGWKKHDEPLWEKLRNEALDRREQGQLKEKPGIFGFDTDRRSVRASIENVDAAGLINDIHIIQRDLSELELPTHAEAGLLIVNPPYGERLGEIEELTVLYADLGDKLKEHFAGWQAAVFTGNTDLAKRMGMRPHKQHALFNGALPCKLLRFDLQEKWFIERPVLSGGVAMPKPAKPEELSDGAQMFANRLIKNMKALKRWAKREEITCYRIYDADLPEYSLAIDLFHDVNGKRRICVQEYEAPKTIDPAKARTRLREALAVLPEILEIPMEQLFFKVRRRQKGNAQYEKQASDENFIEVTEGPCRFLVNFTDYLDVGLFLDHRMTRSLIGKLAANQRVLNLFAYTGSASVHAAMGGAKSTTTIDMSKTYYEWAKRNMELNGFDKTTHSFIRTDCLQWLEEKYQENNVWNRYGLIFLDPPTFSTSKRMERNFDIQKDHVELIKQAAHLLTADGILIFSNNFRKFKMDHEALGDLVIKDITKKTIPKDFSRNRKIHNCWEIKLRTSTE